LQPISPRYVAELDEDGFILAMVLDALEEDSASEQRDLNCLNINPYPEFMPGIGSKAVRDGSREKAIEIEEEPIDKLQEVSIEGIWNTEETHKNANDKFNHPCPGASVSQRVQQLEGADQLKMLGDVGRRLQAIDPQHSIHLRGFKAYKAGGRT
jgi:hypothetical protein